MSICKNCGKQAEYEIETISAGIAQKVWRQGNWILKEETKYNKTLKNSIFGCENCMGRN
ncbi:hypothetical protein J4430_01555 [Candidatus Woesearchaeota archaeon]|nr:hypothetical protein [Candidatus Woesearchaeota archaeon]